MELILFIAVLVGFLYLNSKINAIQQKIDGNAFPPSQVQQPQTQQQFQPQPQNYVQQPSPAPVVMPRSAPAKAASTESSEEVGGRWLGKIGIAAVLIGISFFLKYTFDNNIIGIGGRIILGFVAGLVLLGLGQYLRKKYRLYSEIIMGGGIGVLYLTIYAAFAFYALIPQSFAFVLIALVTLVSVGFSILNDTITLSVIGLIGGFATPLLISFSHDSLFSLFGYVACLDTGVLLVALYKKWINLNYIAFAGTAITFLSWYGNYYRIQDQFTLVFFLTIYFIIFLFMTVSHHIVRKEKTEGVDIALITINGLGYFVVCYHLLNPNFHEYMGFFALIMAAVYIVLSYFAYAADPSDRDLNIYLPALAIVFVTLAVPIQLKDMWITLAWLLESVILASIATATRRPAYVIFGVLVYAIGILNLFSRIFLPNQGSYVPFFNQLFFLFVVAAAAAYVIAYLFSKNSEMNVMGNKLSSLVGIFVVAANVLTVYAITNEIMRFFDQQLLGDHISADITSLINQRNTIISIFWALYSAALIALGFIIPNKLLRQLGLVFFFITAAKIFIDVWSLGQLYRIVSSIIFGIIALVGSFVYAKYKHRINEMIS